MRTYIRIKDSIVTIEDGQILYQQYVTPGAVDTPHTDVKYIHSAQFRIFDWLNNHFGEFGSNQLKRSHYLLELAGEIVKKDAHIDFSDDDIPADDIVDAFFDYLQNHHSFEQCTKSSPNNDL